MCFLIIEKAFSSPLIVFFYCSAQWLKGPLGEEFVDHYSNHDGPRTTNTAEGYHSTQSAVYRSKHLALGEFLSTFQEVHSLEEQEAEDAYNGVIPKKKKDPLYEALDANIAVEKARLRAFLSSIVPVLPGTQQYKDFLISYLSRIGYLIGFEGVTL